MIAAVLGILMMSGRTLAGFSAEDGVPGGVPGLLVALSILLGMAPWMLYLYLFRKSRYP